MVKEDRISNLPDSIIQHILSFLLSTKEAIQTSVLSKRWRKQWSNLPFLIFDLPGKPSDENHISRICTSIDNTLLLHDCSNLKKFHIQSDWYNFTLDPNYISKLRFTIRKEVEDLSLDFSWSADPKKNKLPDFFFNNASLIKLHLNGCSLIPNGSVNWECLKDLYLGCGMFSSQAIEAVVSGSPLLESLNIQYCEGFDLLTIASKSLKILVLRDLLHDFVLQISCPNLVEFSSMTTRGLLGGHVSSSSNGEIGNGLSGDRLHELLEFYDNYDGITDLVIDSTSLKKLDLGHTGITFAVVISCPNLEDLFLSSLPMETIKLMNMPSSVSVTIRFRDFYECNDDLGRMILEQLHHVKELHIGCCIIKILSEWEMTGVSSLSINSKYLDLDCGSYFVENLPGIAYALRTSPELEKLAIYLDRDPCGCGTPVSKKKYVWNSKGAVFNCLVSHLKIVIVYGLSRKHKKELEPALNFIEYLLKNARVLEKMVITLQDPKPDFVFKVSQKLSSFSRFSQHAVVELC